ncbi:MAG TPA: type VI secretion system accessory protein TagJ [Bryobacteraceae bacterium]|nr:type VI secretion system accessory protein TagJ [Bryobacteraceae bacterium]
MSAQELFKAGKLNEAIEALGVEVRDNPTDARRRTFLFELLCFKGDYDRAEKHLNILADATPDARVGAILYFSALHAERLRQDLFEKKDYPVTPATGNPRGGTINGQPFETLEDADPRVGPRLELFAAGAYLWIPLEHIESIELEPPRRLRDLLWAPALVRTGPAFKDTELGEVLLPVLAPFSWRYPDDEVKLGRSTVWTEVDGVNLPSGQRMFSVDEEDFPLLEIRKIEFTPADSDPPAD